jgi:hypothetical protein
MKLTTTATTATTATATATATTATSKNDYSQAAAYMRILPRAGSNI